MTSSACRRRVTGPRRHRCSWWHSSLVEGYRAAVRAQQLRAEAATLGYATELADYYDRLNGVERRVTFRDFLAGYREPREETTA